MKPIEIQAWIKAFTVSIGPKAEVFCSISGLGYPLRLSVYPEGLSKSCALRAEAADWPELFADAKEKWAEREVEFRERLVREMALEIIRLTYEFGQCTDAGLRGYKWTAEDIAHFGPAAVTRANEMAANGPFGIVAIRTANAA